MRARNSRYILISTVLAFMAWICLPPHVALGQFTSTLPLRHARPAHPRALSLAHLYWQFLMYQNHLDIKAADRAKQGQDSTGMRRVLQKSLRLSDADFAPIRISSARLTANIKALDAQALAIHTAGPTLSSYAQLQALTAQRESYISAEISYLKQTLSPQQIAALEAFLVQFFSPANAVPRPPVSVAPSAPAAVQQ